VARTLRPIADREALLALGLAGAGFLSLEATLPAAGLLAFRSIRSRRPGNGTGPAVGVLVLGVGWISFLLGYPTLRSVWITASENPDPERGVTFVAGWLALALSTMVLAHFLVRCHPERWMARAMARAGIAAVIAAGALQFWITTVVRLQDPLRRCGDSLAGCLGSPPWASLVPAIAVGAAWFLMSLMLMGIARAHPWARVRPARARAS
jgi:hypothetical protein